VQGTSFKAGWYLIEAIAKDKYGEEVKDINIFNYTIAKPVFRLHRNIIGLLTVINFLSREILQR